MTTTTPAPRSLPDALDGLRFAMVSTAEPETGRWRSRPLALAGVDGGVLRFLVSVDADWVPGLDGPAGVTFSDPGKSVYVGLQGSARVRDDRALVAELWNPGAAAFFDGEDDPRVRVLEVEVSDGEYWDSPSGRIGTAVSYVKAALGREVGDEGPVVLP